MLARHDPCLQHWPRALLKQTQKTSLENKFANLLSDKSNEMILLSKEFFDVIETA